MAATEVETGEGGGPVVRLTAEEEVIHRYHLHQHRYHLHQRHRHRRHH